MYPFSLEMAVWIYDVEILFLKCALKKNLLINLFPFELLELEDF